MDYAINVLIQTILFQMDNVFGLIYFHRINNLIIKIQNKIQNK